MSKNKLKRIFYTLENIGYCYYDNVWNMYLRYSDKLPVSVSEAIREYSIIQMKRRVTNHVRNKTIRHAFRRKPYYGRDERMRGTFNTKMDKSHATNTRIEDLQSFLAKQTKKAQEIQQGIRDKDGNIIKDI